MSVTFYKSVILSTLSQGRVPLVGVGGLLWDDADLAFDDVETELIVGALTYGSELVTNGTFTGGLTGWSNDYGTFSYGTNNANFSGTVGSLRRGLTLTPGWYKYSYTITNYSGAASHYLAYSSQNLSGSSTGNGTFTNVVYISETSNPTTYFWVAGTTTTLTVDSISITKVVSPTSTVYAKYFAQNGNPVIDNSTIGAQSVAYATGAGTAGSATTADSATTATTATNLNTYNGGSITDYYGSTGNSGEFLMAMGDGNIQWSGI